MPLSTREMPKSEVKSEKKWKDMKKKIARRMSIGSRYLTISNINLMPIMKAYS